MALDGGLDACIVPLLIPVWRKGLQVGVDLRGLKVFVYVFNDYRPEVWGEPAGSYAREYIEACKRYFEGRLNVVIDYHLECPQSIYPSTVIQGFPEGVEKVFFFSTFHDVMVTLRQSGYDAAVFIGRYKVQEALEYSERSFSHPTEKWAYVHYDPPVLNPKAVWSYLYRYSHELSHILTDHLIKVGSERVPINPKTGVKIINTAELDFEPYPYWIDIFEEKYPVQSF